MFPLLLFTSCRRSIIAQHFGEVWETKQCNKMCDNCASERKFTNLPLKEYVKALKSILLQSESMDAKLTGLKLVNALMGRGEGKFKVANWSPPKTFTKTIAEQVILHLLMEGYLKEDFAFTPYSTISYIVRGHIDMNFAEDGVISVLDSQTEAKSKKVGNSKPAPKRKKANLDGDEESSKKSKTNVSTEEDLICIESD